jgi:hypothetical protein
MHLDRGRVERKRLDLDANDLLHLQLLEQSIQNAVLRPAIHSRVDRVPAAESLRKTPPFASLLGNIQYRVQHLQVAQLHVSTLHRQRILNSLILRFGNLHLALKLTEEPYISVNTP